MWSIVMPLDHAITTIFNGLLVSCEKAQNCWDVVGKLSWKNLELGSFVQLRLEFVDKKLDFSAIWLLQLIFHCLYQIMKLLIIQSFLQRRYHIWSKCGLIRCHLYLLSTLVNSSSLCNFHFDDKSGLIWKLLKFDLEISRTDNLANF